MPLNISACILFLDGVCPNQIIINAVLVIKVVYKTLAKWRDNTMTQEEDDDSSILRCRYDL